MFDNGGEVVKIKHMGRPLGGEGGETAPDSPWSIARNDRAHRSAKETLCRVYVDAGSSLPLEAWPEALEHAIWVLNSTPHDGIGGLTPMEKAKGICWVTGESVMVYTGKKRADGS